MWTNSGCLEWSMCISCTCFGDERLPTFGLLQSTVHESAYKERSEATAGRECGSHGYTLVCTHSTASTWATLDAKCKPRCWCSAFMASCMFWQNGHTSDPVNQITPLYRNQRASNCQARNQVSTPTRAQSHLGDLGLLVTLSAYGNPLAKWSLRKLVLFPRAEPGSEMSLLYNDDLYTCFFFFITLY